MGEASARLKLPFLAVGQAGKEETHNEALALLDLRLHAAVEAAGPDEPPGSPADGAAWIVGAAPTGAWAGRAGAIAGWTGGGWRFAEPVEGMVAWVRSEGVFARRVGGAWSMGTLPVRRLLVDGQPVVGARQPAIAGPSGGGTVDAEARAAVSAVLSALRAHGLIAS